MKKLVVPALIFFLLVGLTACRFADTPAPLPPTPVPTVTNTPLPPPPTATPTITPIAPLNSPNGPPLRSIYMFTIRDGWGLIDDALLVTHDAGVSWASVPLPGGQVDKNTEAVFVDLNNAYVLLPAPDGQSGLLHHTMNGGANWEVIPVPFMRGDLSFLGSVGYFLETSSPSGKGAAVYTTLDGVSWNKVVEIGLPDPSVITGLSFISVDRGWMGIASQPQKVTLYQTGNAAQSWALQDVLAPENIGSLTVTVLPPVFFAGDTTNGFLPVDFVSKDIGDRNRVFYFTNDGGTTWSPGASLADGGAYTFVDPTTGWAWGKRGLYVTHDGAQTWELLPGGFNRTEHGTWVNFIDEEYGWLITVGQGSRVRLYHTEDGGSTWTITIP